MKTTIGAMICATIFATSNPALAGPPPPGSTQSTVCVRITNSKGNGGKAPCNITACSGEYCPPIPPPPPDPPQCSGPNGDGDCGAPSIIDIVLAALGLGGA